MTLSIFMFLTTNHVLKHTPLMLAFMPPEPWECPCPPWPPWPWPPCDCPWPPCECPWPPWLCSLWEWPWCECPCSCDEQLLPPWEWAWLKAQMPTRLTSKPPTDTGCREGWTEFKPDESFHIVSMISSCDIQLYKITPKLTRCNQEILKGVILVTKGKKDIQMVWWNPFTHSQHVCVYVGRIQQTGDRLHKDKESDDHQEQAVDESGKNFNTTVPVKPQNTQFIKNPAGGDVLQFYDHEFLMDFTRRRRSWWLSSGSWGRQTGPELKQSSRTACGNHQRWVPGCWSKRHKTVPQRWKPETMQSNKILRNTCRVCEPKHSRRVF